ncbi:MAG: efflux RND transporter permease subunit, partial [Spirochaetaceae bacterium]|nr:efflux RND transporter permease subunit [Spirochaetaceae bacterium]
FVFDITLQRISLGALIIAMGMLVDNSIVITDGILVRMQKGMKAKDASMAVVAQTMWPLFGATVVAIFAFAAVGMSPDATGEYTRTLFLVIIISLLLSWFLAITVNPLICVQFMKIKDSSKKKKINIKMLEKLKSKTGSKKSGGGFMGWYKKILAGSMNHRWITVGVLVGLLILTWLGFGQVTQAFFPSSGQPQFLVDYFMSEGTDINTTERDVIAIEGYLMDDENFPEIRYVSSFIGASPPRFQLTFSPESPNPRLGQFMIEVYDPATINDVLGRIQTYLDEN